MNVGRCVPFVAACTTLAACLGLATVARAAERPNVVIVMTDDQGLGDSSFMGNPALKTPHLDAFARGAVRLTDFHVAPMCSPTRGQLLTGLAALRNGATSVTAGRTFLRPGLPTLPELFRAAGYATGIFGKWHLGDSFPHRPMDKGFEESVHHLGWGQLASTPEAGWPLIDGRLFRNGREERYRGHCTDVWFDEALAWMKRQKTAGRPFLCYIPTNAPHGPHIDLERFIAPYRKPGLPAAFFGMIAHVDERFGDLDRFLTAEGLRDNTLVIFMTDNGGTSGVKLFNAGLRAGKTTLYEGGHRVPCWIRWPAGGLGEPRDVAVPTQNTDLLPTLCELCGVPPVDRPERDRPYAGMSLAGLLRGSVADLPERTLVVQYGQTPTKHDACVIRGPWRLVKGRELYDVTSDRGQTRDVAAAHPDVVVRLRSDYETWWDGIAGSLDDFVPQSLGAEQEQTVEFTSGDWENIYADNVGFVRQAVGGPTGGTWHVRVERPGRYEFVLRRWPPRAAAPLGGEAPTLAGIESQAAVRTFPGIAAAHVDIAGVEAKSTADPTAASATIIATLTPGPTTLKAWFADSAGQPLCGGFFVTVRRLE
jgi:arylsulfatase A-like enzyme